MKKIAIPILVFFLLYFTQGCSKGEIKSKTSKILSILSVQKLKFLKTNSKGFKEYQNKKDGSVLIEIPAGQFTMGSNDYDDEKPVHTVSLDRYYIGKYELTVGQYRKFCNAKGITMPKQPDWNNRDDHPVVNVTWNDAKAYCDWAGLRLPTEAEWEKAARGTDGRKYPWGSSWDGNKCNHGTYTWPAYSAYRDDSFADASDGYESTSPVGSFPSGVSPYGAYDMAGNVSEWCNDWYSSDGYGSSPSSNPTGPSSGPDRVRRGGSWRYGVTTCRPAVRNHGNPDSRNSNFGFRPAK